MNQGLVLQGKPLAGETPLQKSLASIKAKLGYRSAKSFYDQYLTVRTRLDFNYSYFMKIEGGKINPSPQIISNLCSAFEEPDAQEIMLSYCESIFPERAEVFKQVKTAKRAGSTLRAASEPATPASQSGTQSFLTPMQVACLSQSKLHYLAFLLLTLARHPISLSDLKNALPPSKNAGEREIEILIREFTKVRLVKLQDGNVSSIANDMKFPVADSPALKRTYETIDAWNIGFHQDMRFEPVVQKMMLRRVSPRYLSVIQAHCNIMLDLIRASDELDSSYNDEVLMLNVSIQSGNLPG
jgi:hypothetical protein